MRMLLLLLLTGHILGDYYFQSERIARHKETDRKALQEHCLVYGLPFGLIGMLFGLNAWLLGIFFLAFFIHGAIDIGKAALLKKNRKGETLERAEGRIYLLDQFLHWLSLILLAYFFRGRTEAFVMPGIITGIFAELGIPRLAAFQWALALLLIYRPSNITFRKLFSMYKPQPEADDPELTPTINGIRQEKLRAGGIIGVLEKFIALIFLVSGEYMAIGLVLTAKSIARYDKISRSSTFAEYYLIGTLASLIMVLLIHALVFHFLAPLPGT